MARDTRGLFCVFTNGLHTAVNNDPLSAAFHFGRSACDSCYQKMVTISPTVDDLDSVDYAGCCIIMHAPACRDCN